MSTKAEIIADSITSKGCRLTTYVLEYPRFIHSEMLTHRMFSKNAASSRAIPIEKMIQQVIDNPAMPVWWGKNQSGMAAREELSKEKIVNTSYKSDGSVQPVHNQEVSEQENARRIWLNARDLAVSSARRLAETGLHKQIVNRIIEPWFNIRIILSGTEFENFFALRAHPDAQPEIQALAYKMLEEYNKSEPKKLKEGEWHIPFGDKIDGTRIQELQHSPIGLNQTTTDLSIKIAVARCARISYFNYEGKDDYEADIKLCDRLFGNIPRHLSPTEHVAQATNDDKFIGNFKGFKQYRYFFEDQNLKDNRVVKK